MSVKYNEGLVGIKDREACECQDQRDLWLDRRIDYLFISGFPSITINCFLEKPW